MINLSLSEATQAMHAHLLGTDARFSGVSTDTRELSRGELFFALKGERFDGHEMLAQAAERGAAGAVVARDSASTLSLLRVEDTRQALGELARAWRDRFRVPVTAVTGSNGKTSTKEMIASILRTRGEVLATEGNLNNDIGVPKTLFRLSPQHEFAVIEMGANHAGEIAQLVRIAAPRVALVTMCGPAHLEGFGSLDGVAQAKGEIYAGLGPQGTAVINADDPYAPLWRAIAAPARIINFAINHPAEINARGIVLQGLVEGSAFTLVTPIGEIAVTLPLAGQHNVANALGAAGVAFALGFSLDQIKRGLETTPRVKGRLQLRTGYRGLVIVDDSYNANPASLAAAVAALEQRAGRRWLLLGDMGELGHDGPGLHREAGLNARNKGIERLLTLGPLAREAGLSFGAGARHFSTHEEAIDAVRAAAAPNITLLVKGSRMMQLERVVAALTAEDQPQC